MAWEARSGLKQPMFLRMLQGQLRLNGLGSPFGIETVQGDVLAEVEVQAKWPGKPVRD